MENPSTVAVFEDSSSNDLRPVPRRESSVGSRRPENESRPSTRSSANGSMPAAEREFSQGDVAPVYPSSTERKSANTITTRRASRSRQALSKKARFRIFITQLIWSVSACTFFGLLDLHLRRLLWIAPIIALLSINMRQGLHGTSFGMHVGCLSCYFVVWEWTPNLPNALFSKREFAHNEHLVMSFIQLSAKVLEIWFLVPATLLVYLLVVKQAINEQGVPYGWLSAHEGFPSVFNVLARSPWAPLKAISEKRPEQPVVWRYWGLLTKRELWLPCAFILLTGLANVVGPSIAVLSIPKLSWIDQGDKIGPRFLDHDYATPPERLPSCSDEEVRGQSYACSGYYVHTIDQFVETHAFFDDGPSSNYSIGDSIDIPVPGADIIVNIYYDKYGLAWVPNKMALTALAERENHVKDGPKISAQQIEYHTTGNMAILSTDCSKNTKYSIETLPGKTLQCFTGPFDHKASAPFKKPPFDRFNDYEQDRGPSSWETQETNLTYCFPVGTGWDAVQSQSQLTLHGQANVTDLPYADLTILSSAKSLYFPGSSNLSSCTLVALDQGRWPDNTCEDDILHFSMGNSSLLYYDLPGMDKTIFCPFNLINHFVDYSVNPVHISQSVNISGRRFPLIWALPH